MADESKSIVTNGTDESSLKLDEAILSIPSDKKCGYCKASYKYPKVLTCFHTFCFACIQDCIEKSVFKNTFLCPDCQQAITVPQNGAADFKGLQFYQPNIIVQPAPRICDVCQQSDASVICMDCEEFQCEPCKESHENMRVAKDHHHVDLASAKKCSYVTEDGLKVVLCSEHSKWCQTYCLKCKIAICENCKSTTHRKHECKQFEEEADLRRNDIKELLEKELKPAISSVATALQESERVKTLLEEDAVNKEINWINDRVQSLKDQLDEIAKTKIEYLQKERETAQEFNSRRMLVIKSLLSSLEEKEKLVQSFCDTVNDTKIMSEQEVIKTDLNTVQAQNKLRLLLKREFRHKSPIDKSEDVKDCLSKLLGTITIEPSLNRILLTRLTSTCTSKVVKFWSGAVITGLYPVTNHDALAAYSRYLQPCSSSGSWGKAVDMAEDVNDMVEDNHGNIFVACETSVKRVDTTGKVLEKIPLPRPKPTGIAAEDGNLLVTFHTDSVLLKYKQQEGKWYEINPFDEENIKEVSLPTDSSTPEASDAACPENISDPPLCPEEETTKFHPNRIRINPANGFIYISEHNWITMLDASLKIKMRIELPAEISYEKAEDIETRKGKLNLQSLFCSKEGHVWLHDIKKDETYLFSEEGKFVQVLSYPEKPDNAPSCIFVDASNKIWTGTKVGDMKLFSISFEDKAPE